MAGAPPIFEKYVIVELVSAIEGVTSNLRTKWLNLSFDASFAKSGAAKELSLSQWRQLLSDFTQRPTLLRRCVFYRLDVFDEDWLRTPAVGAWPSKYHWDPTGCSLSYKPRARVGFETRPLPQFLPEN
jgi:hypothetical protein